MNIDWNNPRKHDYLHISVRSGKQAISTSESFDRVKLSRLKYLQLQTNKYWSEFNFKWLVSLFTVMESLIFENTDSINIVCGNCVKYEYRVSTCCLFRPSVRG